MSGSAAGEPENPGRRAFLGTGAAAGSALLLGFYLPLGQGAPRSAAQAGGQRFEPNAFIRIDRQGVITLVMPQVEMGQGIYTGLAMVLAEELDVGAEQVVLETAPPATSCMAIRFSACRRPAVQLPCVRSGCRCAKPARAHVRCWCRPRPRCGMPMQRVPDRAGRGHSRGERQKDRLWRAD